MLKIDGLDQLTRQLEDASRAFQSLDGEIANIVPGDRSSVQAAIVQLEATIDQNAAPIGAMSWWSRWSSSSKSGIATRSSSADDGAERMQRDMDLIRELLLKLEALPANRIVRLGADDVIIQIGRYSPEEVFYHLALLKEAFFIHSVGSGRMGSIEFAGLTWAGHDFLDSVRSPDVWDKTKQLAAAAGGFTVELLVATAKSYLEGKIKRLVGG
ncbi:DUF2513 domain-containing protein [Caballeronia sp. S22]|uniref:DUF2513 domain-containing protein n=1 Tax=Caballeronia sp. S22 TaxID=3137182 RepID=UPI00353169FA